MISFNEAFEIVCTLPVFNTTETVPFDKSTDRILAENIFSDIDMPPFDKSAVDGFACRKEDVACQMKIIETVPAGKLPQKEIVKNTCIRIMTGAPLPVGADIVLMVELCDVNDEMVLFKGKASNSNIAYKGEDIKTGALLMQASLQIKPQHIAVLAAVGKTEIEVFKKINVGVISTGNELVEPFYKPSEAQIRNSNSWQLVSQVEKHGGKPKYYGIASDDFNETVNTLQNAVNENDLVLLSGGVSAGDFDFVPKAMNQIGFDILFDSIAVQPGRPTTLAKKDKKFIIGLPGNPVSYFIQFELLGSVLMGRMMGKSVETKVIKGIVGSDFKRKKAERKSFYPVSIDNMGNLVPLEYHGSAHINSLINAVGFISLEIGQYEIKKGTEIDVRLL
jgi:molybdopterin molybdotransferase